MMEFADKGIKTAIITLFRYLKEHMNSEERNARLEKQLNGTAGDEKYNIWSGKFIGWY